jgi:type II restriction enzyme
VLARADGAAGTIGKPIPARVLGSLQLEVPHVGLTESFLSIGAFKSKIEARNALKYCKTRFTRILVGILKNTQDITPQKWRYVPLQDFTSASDIDWSGSVEEIDKQLYKKYKLTKAEIKFIETHVKAME